MTLTKEKVEYIKNQKKQIKDWQSKLSIFNGLTINKISYEKFDDPYMEGYSKYGLVIHIKNPTPNCNEDIKLNIMSDDEGNDIGSIHTNLKQLEIIPTI